MDETAIIPSPSEKPKHLKILKAGWTMPPPMKVEVSESWKARYGTSPSGVKRLVNYSCSPNMFGETESTTEYECDMNDAAIYYAQLFGSTDPNNPSSCPLVIGLITITYWDIKNGVTKRARLTCRGVPWWKWDELYSDGVFTTSREAESGSITLPSQNLVWKTTGDAVPMSVHALHHFSLVALLFKGNKSRLVDVGSNALYIDNMDTLNSLAFMGWPVGCVMYNGMSSTPRVLPSGAMTNDVVVKFTARRRPWSQWFNLITGQWDDVVLASDGTTSPWELTDFTGMIPAVWV